ncbi:TrbG/VirB9 family P-type conjugative transfer protein [Pseudodesulfovibrio senegalensis]|uniref:TrbG/VirB9 family P-type conjugative transfer protein n=1 Tax=Pseudodesulfovibrio senegalensis TaxID=1721087 RepID=A0A6N6MY48_9BACT|nr:TrbG/VirB9 family P-type conjugative transfer protein [Pseudodesulfovibrio senegalensis]KAB1437303.1 TrbG/VirB9 family P-type conjugative transfer protein [Pseudodesulfovibrio senegalensis]
MKKFIVILCLIAVAACPAWAKKRDAFGQAESGESAITNRPMMENINLQAVQKAFDDSNSTANIKEYSHYYKNTYKIRLRQYMTTTIILPQNENVEALVLGDEMNFSVKALRFRPKTPANKLEIFGKRAGADTNLTVMGESGNIYSFYLRIDDPTSPYLPDLIVYLKDNRIKFFRSRLLANNSQSDSDLDFRPKDQDEKAPDYLVETSPVPPSEWNFDYQIDAHGHGFAPRQIFDDGKWTYFRFGANGNMDTVKTLPIIYAVRDGVDVPINQQRKGEFVVVKTTSNSWTLWAGDKYICARQGK